ncbi:class I SAM-dependent methyltransferase [Nocardioides marmorisolisilvae]|uniref:class I SAM-dependent methyltransferase n=1 Tax=Nocardioides marmorisolisilvae TaxID=1542737 RepID=UPI00160F451A|nr:class I SAM-dependent methyltransferase [Nocardioides marmorisolisilvae]
MRVREALTLAKALAVGGERREAAVAIITKPKNLFQPYTTTSANRYPDEFRAVADALTTETPRILSFGCSTGEELVSLRAAFPGASIHGVDVNPLAVRKARRRVAGDARTTVARGGEAPDASYDVVLALAVFRHAALNDAPPSCAGVLAFADFDRTVGGLAASVRPGGLLVIRHANFRFSDTSAAAAFEVVSTGYASAGEGGLPTPLYDRDDRLIGVEPRDDGVYRRLS